MLPPPSWSGDRRLDILILGPMSEDETIAASCVPVQRAVQALLQEPEFETALVAAGIAAADRLVHVPETFRGGSITDGVLARLDIADLVIFNLTPKEGKSEASANVLYELGLVHALGIPSMFVIQEKPGEPSGIPFYAREMHQHRVADFSGPTLAAALRPALFDFLTSQDPLNSFCNDRVTLFYGLPIVDISAAVGLATGYYYNFVSRLITEGGFLGHYPDKIRQLVLVRPESIDSTYQADAALLKKSLADAGLNCETVKLDPPAGDTLGPLWFDHVDGVVIDIPRTVYPLQRAPRLLAYHQRRQRGGLRGGGGAGEDRSHRQRLVQFSDRLIGRFMDGIRYQTQVDGPRVRSRMLHITSLREAAGLVKELLG